jgi:hypothetical protein
MVGRPHQSPPTVKPSIFMAVVVFPPQLPGTKTNTRPTLVQHRPRGPGWHGLSRLRQPTPPAAGAPKRCPLPVATHSEARPSHSV